VGNRELWSVSAKRINGHRLTYISGTVSIADLSFIGNEETASLYSNDLDSEASLYTQMSVANAWGITGQEYEVFPTTIYDDNGYEQSIYSDENGSAYWYRFIDRSPSKNALTATTDRTINTTATCKPHEILYGGYGGFQTDDDTIRYALTYKQDDGSDQTLWVPDVATGSTTWMSNTTSDCGPRCMQIYALQTANNATDDVPIPKLWSCEATVQQVSGIDPATHVSIYQLPDTQASILAGAIGWSGIATISAADTTSDTTSDPATSLQMVRYPPDSQWSPSGAATASDMARLVMKFTTGAIAALDNNGPRLNATGLTPQPAQFVNIQWRYAGAILAGIPFVQGMVWIIVIMCANKAIIKDTSHLSTARLLRPVVDRLGDSGCLLTGDEIAEKLGNFRVIYGVRDPGAGGGWGMDTGIEDDGRVRHVDVIEEEEGLGRRKGRMPQGRYDGLYPDGSMSALERSSSKLGVVGYGRNNPRSRRMSL
jgi:hypothetical protein